jgi:hypothetical protein
VQAKVAKPIMSYAMSNLQCSTPQHTILHVL